MYEISHFPGRGLGGGKDRVHPWHFEPGTCLTEKNGPCMDCAMSGGNFAQAERFGRPYGTVNPMLALTQDFILGYFRISLRENLLWVRDWF